MTAGRLAEIVLMAPVSRLRRASALLAEHGIQCRYTRPRRQDGTLRVSSDDAERARAVLAAKFPSAERVSRAEAAWFRCQACGAPLSFGAFRCAACGAIVGDPQAL